MVNWLGLLVPFAYLGLLVGSLITFSSLNRKRKIAKEASLEPWFPPHLQRNLYLSLMHLEPESTEKRTVPVPDSVLKAALLRRATEDIHRILAIRNAKTALNSLLQRGSVGDELWQRFLRAEKEMEDELRDVVSEANAFSPDWGNTIFQTANEMAANAMLRTKVEEIQAQAKSEREWWDVKRTNIQTEFMKELNGPSDRPKSSGERPGSEDDTVVLDPAGVKTSTKKKKGKK
ncbi:MAG: translocation protein S66 [Vezdaea aestivalis]|nr:MAG: translocation protein S66 [Vezdaea aestivalis]